jgi:hypothetical protein
MKGLRCVRVGLLREHLVEMSKSREVHYASSGSLNGVPYRVR